jgi:pimeloyl-ACP methyl ester carboxylesterase
MHIETNQTARCWRRAALGAVLLAPLLLFGACSDDGGSEGAPTASSTTGAGATSVATTPPDRQAPTQLPARTPVSIDYEVSDPSFSAMDGARAIFGEHEDAGYQIEVPDDWNGSVVYFAHGFRGNPPELNVQMPPIREHLIENGYAWAASSYSANGYEPGIGAKDTVALRDVVREELGDPAREYIYGQSMGGNVATVALEQYPDAFDGAVSECGVLSGNDIFDWFLSWGTLASYFSGVPLYEATVDAKEIGSLLAGQVVPALGPPAEPTAAGEMFANAVMHLTGGARPYFGEGFTDNYNFNFVILVNAVGAPGRANAAAQNVDTDYVIDTGFDVTTEQLNREIARVAANWDAVEPESHPEFADMTGEIEVPLLALHNTGDLFVPISVSQSYTRAVDAAGNSDLLVQRAVRRSGHCNFRTEERIKAFDDMVAWAAGGAKPGGDDFTGSLENAGLDWTIPLEDDDPANAARPPGG